MFADVHVYRLHCGRILHPESALRVGQNKLIQMLDGVTMPRP